MRSVLSQCAGPSERAERALELLVHHVRGVGGYLFTYSDVEMRLALIAPQHGDDKRSINPTSVTAVKLSFGRR